MSIEQYIAIHRQANELLKLHGLTEKGWKFELSKRKRQVGTCFYRTKTIAFSEYFLNSPPEQITDTLLHEIAHAIAGEHGDYGHGKTWKVIAKHIGANPDRIAHNVVNTAKHNYLLECVPCKLTWRRYRLKRRQYWCPRCNSALVILQRDTTVTHT